MKVLCKLAFLAAAVVAPSISSGAVIYNSWTSNDAGVTNTTVSATLNGSVFDVSVTVNPWNAELLGLFIDWGNVNLSNTTLSNVSPLGQVSVVATDSTSSSCGTGCNINGLNAPLANPDNQWEWIIRLGDAGYDGIQTFSFSLAANGRTEADWGVVALRAQQLCPAGVTLPSERCSGSDKSYATGSRTTTVPEPGTLALLGLGLLGLGLARRRLVR